MTTFFTVLCHALGQPQPPPPAAPALADELNQFDLAFVVDTTGSMGSLITAAKQQMITMIETLAAAAEVDMRLAVVEYRDHPPQDKMVYRVYPFTADLAQAQQTINGLKADGGGDMPEAVLDGVLAACRELEWRSHARRLAVLVGDAPPHARCACGETIQSVSAAAEQARVTLYALGLTPSVAEPFGDLSRLTGGEFFATGQAQAAIKRLESILSDEFGQLEFDRRVLHMQRSSPDGSVAELAETLATTRGAVAAAINRLNKRQLA
ncbi:MAG: VWA domain-containing protein [Chloroflexaceae bacterium]|jgi:hypothetical protein|nr:VWA domain-containing protein [Chloroflexaceae bacterium]